MTWRSPAEETEDYPGLIVHDGRQTGSITFGRSRLPLWAIIGELIRGDGWAGVETGWEPSQYGWDEEGFAEFLAHLLNMRGEFARLLCVLANEERKDMLRQEEAMDQAIEEGHPAVQDGLIDVTPDRQDALKMPGPWWEDEEARTRIVDQLRRCLDALEAGE